MNFFSDFNLIVVTAVVVVKDFVTALNGVIQMKKYFTHSDLKGPIQYEGPKTDNPFAFRWYNPDRQVLGKSMKDHLRFSIVYWHTLCGTGNDPFGPGTAVRPWHSNLDPIQRAYDKADALFELCQLLGVPYYAFHDRDLVDEGDDLAETNRRLDIIVNRLKEKQQETGIKLLWGTANLFSNPRYMHGAATSPYAKVYAFAAAQVKKALEITLELGGENYVFWGGREGYQNLYNTDMKRELDNLARFFRLAGDYAKEIGFKGPFLIEPKPKEPTKHQYDSDVAACLNFLRQYNLMDLFKLNIETNHATLAGHTMMHELELAGASGVLGSIDANTGDLLLGWDTDEFLTDPKVAAEIMWTVLKYGGFTTGGVNFDAKVRRESHEPIDLVHAHLGGMDTFAKGLLIAEKIIQDDKFSQLITGRYSSWNDEIGTRIHDGTHNFKSLEELSLQAGDVPLPPSGGQERLANLFARYAESVE